MYGYQVTIAIYNLILGRYIVIIMDGLMHNFTVIESYLASSGLKNNLFLKEIPPLYTHF
ncbi:hypothetical protein Hanom_Chr00s000005g01612001 [Helianthus anomalus]